MHERTLGHKLQKLVLLHCDGIIEADMPKLEGVVEVELREDKEEDKEKLQEDGDGCLGV